jgi:small multidrug resistance family-3 protein
MTVARSILLFLLAALAEIGGAWLVWQGWREHRGVLWIAGGIIALGLYGFVGPSSPIRTSAVSWPPMAACSLLVSLGWGMVFDKFRPDRYDIIGAAICLVGVAVIMYAPRTT